MLFPGTMHVYVCFVSLSRTRREETNWYLSITTTENNEKKIEVASNDAYTGKASSAKKLP